MLKETLLTLFWLVCIQFAARVWSILLIRMRLLGEAACVFPKFSIWMGSWMWTCLCAVCVLSLCLSPSCVCVCICMCDVLCVCPVMRWRRRGAVSSPGQLKQPVLTAWLNLIAWGQCYWRVYCRMYVSADVTYVVLTHLDYIPHKHSSLVTGPFMVPLSSFHTTK